MDSSPVFYVSSEERKVAYMPEEGKCEQLSLLFDELPDAEKSTNLFVRTTINAMKAPENERPQSDSVTDKKSKKASRIEDFGEKIGGARKDVYTAYLDMLQMANESEVKTVPLSKSWPAPNYTKLLDSGMAPWKVHAVRALRETLLPKPSPRHFAISRWANYMTFFRDLAVSVLESNLDEYGLCEELAEFTVTDRELPPGFKTSRQLLADRATDLMLAYKILGHDRSLAKLRFIERDVDIEPDPARRVELREYTGKYTYREILFAPTRRDAIRQYKEMDHSRDGHSSDREARNPFGIYRWKGHEEYFIGRKLGKTWLEVATPFATPEEARDYMASHLDSLKAKYEEMKQVPFERENENTPRIGTLRRKEDVTPELFAETFGFRGVEFGNWVENKKRQDDLNQAYDALMDLSSALHLPPKAMSLSGSLALAFGARGRGGRQAPSAHYEPVRIVINLTKEGGAGSLAHEWLHAVDNYFARRDGGSPVAMMTQKTMYAGDVREEVRQAFQGIRECMRGTGYHHRCMRLDSRRKDSYWSLPEEMTARAFEAYIKESLQEQGIRNDYLVNIRDRESWDKATGKTDTMSGTYPYPSGEELKPIRKAFDNLFATIQFREHDRGYELYSASAGNLSEMIATATVTPQEELSPEQQTLQVFSKEVMGIDLTFFHGAKELHGRYDEDGDRFYVNQDAEVSMDWILWHEAFHAMKEHEPDLYADLLCHAEKTEMFSKAQLDGYRREVQRPRMSDDDVTEELLANAFADYKTGRRVLQDMAKVNPALVQRLAAFTQKILHSAQRLFHLREGKSAQELRENYPGVCLTDRQFRDFSERIADNLCSLRDSRDQPMFLSKGYRILAADGRTLADKLSGLPRCTHSPFQYTPLKQQKFDRQAAKELLRHYSPETVARALQELSPMGERLGCYGRRLIQEAVKTAER